MRIMTEISIESPFTVDEIIEFAEELKKGKRTGHIELSVGSPTGGLNPSVDNATWASSLKVTLTHRTIYPHDINVHGQQ